MAGERNGAWGTARELPGTAALNQGGAAAVMWVSCAVAGDCAAAGYYTDSSRRQQALVASEVNGTWQKAIEVPGTAALNRGRVAAADSVSCASAGNCAAGGSYISSGDGRAFVASEVNGIWHAAIQVPGTAALNQGGGARAGSVSCASAGNCAAAGEYTDGSGDEQAFVAGEVNGIWQRAIEVPGTAALNQGGHAGISSVSCASAGNCAAAGSYTDSSGHAQAFVASEVNATWGAAIEVPGTAALNQGGHAGISSVSCASAGNCAAAGSYTDSSGHAQAFVAGEVNGIWQKAIEVPGTAALNQGGHAGIGSVSCASAGNCAAAGGYTDSSGREQALVAGEVNGIWQKAIRVPGTAALNQGGHAGAFSVSCASAGNCGAGGGYADSSGHAQAFVVNQTTRT